MNLTGEVLRTFGEIFDKLAVNLCSDVRLGRKKSAEGIVPDIIREGLNNSSLLYKEMVI
jgi:hypothetical protein